MVRYLSLPFLGGQKTPEPMRLPRKRMKGQLFFGAEFLRYLDVLKIDVHFFRWFVFFAVVVVLYGASSRL